MTAKKKTTTTTKTGIAALVGTQRSALKAITTKRALAAFAVKLAAEHGSNDHKALKRAELERWKRNAIRAHIVEVAVRAQRRRRVHLSELGGWPVCWSDGRREEIEPEELLTTPLAVNEQAVTCTRCKKAAELSSPEETAALKRAEVGAEQQPKRRKQVASKTKGKANARAKRQLKLKNNLPVRLRCKGLEVKGVLRPDGSLSVKGKSHASPHAAASELAGDLVSYRIDGFQAWRYQDADGKWRMLRDHS